MDRKFNRLICQEAFLAKSCLVAGFNLLSRAGLDEKKIGNFYSGWFQLTIGFERLMKIVLTADKVVNNDGQPFTDNTLKNYSHRLKEMYFACKVIYKKNIGSDINLDECSTDLLEFLNEFAVRSRFYNLGELSTPRTEQDPLRKWYGVSWEISNKFVPEYVRKRRFAKVRKFVEQNGLASKYLPQSVLTDYPELYTDFYIKNEIILMATPYTAWLLIEILHPMYSVLSHLEYKEVDKNQTELNRLDIPYLSEFFPFLLQSKREILRKKGRIPLDL